MDILHELDLSITRAADALKVRCATLSDLVDGKTALTAEMALRIEKAFGVDMDILLRMQAAYDFAQAKSRTDQIDVEPFRAA